jgi:hypothetical protein
MQCIGFFSNLVVFLSFVLDEGLALTAKGIKTLIAFFISTRFLIEMYIQHLHARHKVVEVTYLRPDPSKENIPMAHSR